jgi:hypothetical protein
MQMQTEPKKTTNNLENQQSWTDYTCNLDQEEEVEMAAATPDQPRGHHGKPGLGRIWGFRPLARRIQGAVPWPPRQMEERRRGLQDDGHERHWEPDRNLQRRALSASREERECVCVRSRGRGRGRDEKGEWEGRACLLFRAGNGLFITGPCTDERSFM